MAMYPNADWGKLLRDAIPGIWGIGKETERFIERLIQLGFSPEVMQDAAQKVWKEEDTTVGSPWSENRKFCRAASLMAAGSESAASAARAVGMVSRGAVALCEAAVVAMMMRAGQHTRDRGSIDDESFPYEVNRKIR